MANLIAILEQAGFHGEALRKAWAVAMRESGGRADAFNGNTATGDRSYGLFQINMLGNLGPARMKKYGLSSEKDLLDPVTNARVAFQMTNGGRNWFSWDIDQNGYDGGSHAAAFQKWYAKFPGAKGGGPDVGGGKAGTPARAADGSLVPDKISDKAMRAKYQVAAGALAAIPSVKKLIAQGIKENWSDEQFMVAMRNDPWYQSHSQTEREALAAKAIGGADWDVKLQEGRTAVQAEATRQGVSLSPQELDHLAEQYQLEGWDQPDRAQQMAIEIAGQNVGGPEGEMLKGAGGNLQQELLDIAAANGLGISREFAQSAARSVAMGLTTEDDWRRQVMEQSASVWGPYWQDKILAGVSAKQLASGYITSMARTLDLNPESIDLNDPYLRKAMTAVDDKGNPVPMSIYDFEATLRKDPRYMNTKKASDDVASVGNQILKMFGFAAG